MKIQLIPLILILVLYPLQLNAIPISVEDDSGGLVILPSPAKRIVSLYPALSEIVDALGFGTRVLGATKRDPLYSRIPGIEIVGTHMRPNLEIIVGLAPDLVLQGSSRHDALVVTEALKRRSIPVALFCPYTFEQLFSAIRRIGILLGAEDKSKQLTKNLKKKLLEINNRYPACEPRPKVFFEINRVNLLGAGTRSIVNDIILKAGGENVVNVPKRIVRFNREALLKAKPDIYVVQKGPMNRGASTLFDSAFFYSIPAVAKGNVLLVDEYLFSRPGPNSVKAVEILAKFIYSHFTNPPKNTNKNNPVATP